MISFRKYDRHLGLVIAMIINLSKIFFNQVYSIFTRMRAIIAGYVRFAHLSRRLYDVTAMQIIAQSHVDTCLLPKILRDIRLQKP